MEKEAVYVLFGRSQSIAYKLCVSVCPWTHTHTQKKIRWPQGWGLYRYFALAIAVASQVHLPFFSLSSYITFFFLFHPFWGGTKYTYCSTEHMIKPLIYRSCTHQFASPVGFLIGSLKHSSCGPLETRSCTNAQHHQLQSSSSDDGRHLVSFTWLWLWFRKKLGSSTALMIQ